MRLIVLLLSVIVLVSPMMHTGNAMVQTGVSLVGTNNVPAGTLCSAGSGTYTSSPTDMWGQAVARTIIRTYICVQNRGSSAYTVHITSTLPTPEGTITTAQFGSTLVAGAYALIEFDWTVPATTKPGQVSFTVTFRSR